MPIQFSRRFIDPGQNSNNFPTFQNTHVFCLLLVLRVQLTIPVDRSWAGCHIVWHELCNASGPTIKCPRRVQKYLSGANMMNTSRCNCRHSGMASDLHSKKNSLRSARGSSSAVNKPWKKESLCHGLLKHNHLLCPYESGFDQKTVCYEYVIISVPVAFHNFSVPDKRLEKN